MDEFIFQDITNKEQVLKFLTKQNKNGLLPGFYGRLGDLGKKYNIQVSAFASNCIVVDTPDTGAKCIELLSKNDIGRGSFIALDAQETCSQTNSPYPDGVVQLFEIIRSDLRNAVLKEVKTYKKIKLDVS